MCGAPGSHATRADDIAPNPDDATEALQVAKDVTIGETIGVVAKGAGALIGKVGGAGKVARGELRFANEVEKVGTEATEVM
jgi:hypothetical protein